MANFLICGLPRSMTLWMSEFLTHGESVCTHEPLIYMNTKEDIKAFYASPVRPANLGISDSGAGWFLDYILSEVGPQTLIIERDINEVQASLDGMGLRLPKTNYLDLLQARLNAAESPLIKRVKFRALQDMAVMAACFAHLLPNTEFDETHYKTLIQRKITVDPQQVLKELNRKGTLFTEVFKTVRPKDG